jgi:hypothetical protein
MAMDFPNSPTVGTLYDTGTGVVYAWDGTAWVVSSMSRLTARRGNRVVNGNMAISQENGNNVVSTSGSYPADQWRSSFSGLSSQFAQMLGVTSGDGSSYSLNQYFSAAKASLAAGDYSLLVGQIEGQNIADLQWGNVNRAIPAVLRFNAFCETAGTYSVSIGNLAADQSWLGSFTCDGSTVFKTFVFAIPAYTTGTWARDNTLGVRISFVYAAGSTYVGVAGWQTGNKLVVPAQTNGAAVTNKGLYITDVGLYADPDNTGLPPPWEVPDYATELNKCRRYWTLGTSNIRTWVPTGVGSANWECVYAISPPMRVTPAVGGAIGGSWVNINSTVFVPLNATSARINMANTATGDTYVLGVSYPLNSRM